MNTDYKSLPRQEKPCRDNCPGWAVHWECDSTSPHRPLEGSRTRGFMVLFSPTKESARAEFEDMQFRHLEKSRNLRVTDVKPA